MVNNSWTDTLLINQVTEGTMNILRNIGVFKSKAPSPAASPTQVLIKMPLWELARDAGPFVRLAGLSGASAVVLGAMGAHRTFPETETKEDLRKIFDTANRFHFLHTLALVTVPLCKRPYMAGAFFIAGMGLFCGTCYYHAFTGERGLRRLTPIGGSCLILGWLAMTSSVLMKSLYMIPLTAPLFLDRDEKFQYILQLMRMK